MKRTRYTVSCCFLRAIFVSTSFSHILVSAGRSVFRSISAFDSLQHIQFSLRFYSICYFWYCMRCTLIVFKCLWTRYNFTVYFVAFIFHTWNCTHWETALERCIRRWKNNFKRRNDHYTHGHQFNEVWVDSAHNVITSLVALITC